MAANYLGETEILIEDSPFKGYKKLDWIEYYINRHGAIDGSHHKTWVLDQIMRIRFNTPVIIMKAEWENQDAEFRVHLGKPSKKYKRWVKGIKNDGYDYDEGSAP